MKNTVRTVGAALAATSLALSLAACGSTAPIAAAPAPAIPSSGDSAKVTLARDTAVLSKEGQRDLLAVESDGTLRFDRRVNRSSRSSGVQATMVQPIIDDGGEVYVGQTIASEPISMAPDGFLVRVTNVYHTPYETIVDTEPAAIEEAVENGETHLGDAEAGESLAPDEVVSVQAHVKGVTFGGDRLSAQGSFLKFRINLDDVELGSGANTLKVNGFVNFDASAHARIKVGWFKLKHFSASVKLDAQEHLEIHGTAGASWSKEVRLATYRFRSFTVWMGPIPVVFRPEITVVLGANGQVSGRLDFVADRRDTLEAGAKYEGGWSPIWNRTSSTTLNLSMQGSFQNRAYVGANAGLYLYGLVGPFVYVKPFIDFRAEAHANMAYPDTGSNAASGWYTVHGGFATGVGIDASKIKRSLRWTYDFPEYKVELARGGNVPGSTPDPDPTPPTPPAPPSPYPDPGGCNPMAIMNAERPVISTERYPVQPCQQQ